MGRRYIKRNQACEAVSQPRICNVPALTFSDLTWLHLRMRNTVRPQAVAQEKKRLATGKPWTIGQNHRLFPERQRTTAIPREQDKLGPNSSVASEAERYAPSC